MKPRLLPPLLTAVLFAFPAARAHAQAAPAPAPAPAHAPAPAAAAPALSPPPESPTGQTSPTPAAAPTATPATPAQQVKIRLGIIPNAMQFDQKTLTVKPGQKVILLFENLKCPQLHNFVLVKPGKLNEIGNLSEKMLQDPQGLAKQYLPASPGIIAHSSKFIGIGQKDLIQFTAPTQPGDYPYLCTFPSHWRLMNGILKVAP